MINENVRKNIQIILGNKFIIFLENVLEKIDELEDYNENLSKKLDF